MHPTFWEQAKSLIRDGKVEDDNESLIEDNKSHSSYASMDSVDGVCAGEKPTTTPAPKSGGVSK